MAKQQTSQRFVLKIHSKFLKDNNFNINVTVPQAKYGFYGKRGKKNISSGEKPISFISLTDSQVLRWIDELNGDRAVKNVNGMDVWVDRIDEQARSLKSRIYQLKHEPASVKAKHEIESLYNQLDELQYRPDYVDVVMDSKSQYKEVNKGFTVNGIKYRRLLGTTGGVKCSTIVYVSERVYEELVKRINNGRDVYKEFVPAKLQAYMALTCSGSIPLSDPDGDILVVNDCITHFKDDVTIIDTSVTGEPLMEDKHDYECEVNASDGYGLITYELAQKWSNELRMKSTMSGCCIRNAFLKGMVFPFPFRKFCKEIAIPVGKDNMVKDVWGEYHDINKVEMILTTSMLKLWDSYHNFDEYWKNCKENNYSFATTKQCEEELDEERNLNYQFIQSYHLTDKQIENLVLPTCNSIREVLCGDWRKALLFLNGTRMENSEEYLNHLPDDWIKALMLQPELFNDSYFQKRIFSLIKMKINDAKIGRIKVKGNFQVASGDPYALCQSIFGLEVTGLLKSKEIYSKFWADKNVDAVVMFRAPMSCHANIVKSHVANNEQVRKWYMYMKTVTILSPWDNSMAALNGCDFDSDLIFSTNNSVLVDAYEPNLPVLCVQYKAEKKIPSESDFVKCTSAGFGSNIGIITNRITSMFEVQSHFPPNSKEYKVLDYRIKCGEAYQQSEIDAIKGVITSPMPKYWYDRSGCIIEDDDTEEQKKEKIFNLSIVAEKKPYFMSFVYAKQHSDLNTYIANRKGKCLRKFGVELETLMNIPKNKLTKEQQDFLTRYYSNYPVSVGSCTMNKVCKTVELHMSDCKEESRECAAKFNTSLLKAGIDYRKSEYEKVKKVYDSLRHNFTKWKAFTSGGKIDSCDSNYSAYEDAKNELNLVKQELDVLIQNNASLCDIMVDLAYRNNNTKYFLWEFCGQTIVKNLEDSIGAAHIIVADANGDIIYKGEKYSDKVVKVGQGENNDS